MSSIQLNFTLRTSSKCKTVHLVGSWDHYKSNLPLNRDSSKSGGWKGTFRFAPPTLVPGGRYWYYYIIDGYHVSHDPAQSSTVEPTTGRMLNILDIPAGRASGSSHSGHGHTTQNMAPSSSGGGSGRHHRTSATNGRALSPSQIQHPYPSRPYETQVFRSEKFSSREMEALSRRYAAQKLADSSSDTETSDSDRSGSLPSLSSRSSYNSSPSSVSSVGSPLMTPGSAGGSPQLPAGYAYAGAGTAGAVGLGIRGCTCERYAVMKDGRKFRVDCQGKVCGYGAALGGVAEESSACSESSSEDEKRRKGKHRSSHSSKHKKGLRIRR